VRIELRGRRKMLRVVMAVSKTVGEKFAVVETVES